MNTSSEGAGRVEATARRLGFWEPAGYCQQSQLSEKKMKQNSGGCVVVLVGATSPEEGGQARLGLCSPLGPHVSMELKKGSSPMGLPGGWRVRSCICCLPAMAPSAGDIWYCQRAGTASWVEGRGLPVCKCRLQAEIA